VNLRDKFLPALARMRDWLAGRALALAAMSNTNGASRHRCRKGNRVVADRRRARARQRHDGFFVGVWTPSSMRWPFGSKK
jgi:hypothetical protein